MDQRIDRRHALGQIVTGASALAAHAIGGSFGPRAARAQGAALRHFSADEAATLEVFGDTLLPGAAEAGIAHYIDDQLGREDSLLFLKYVDWTGRDVDFYAQGLRALERHAAARNGVSFTAASPAQRAAVVRAIAATTPGGWTGPPAPLFYFVARNDALDVCYGTADGLAHLQVPYMPHIVPPAKW